jgi:acetyl-CoA C-acetyltransferase
MADRLVIVATRRTPIGSFQGMFSQVSATALGAAAARGALADADAGPDDIDEVVFGCVLPAGLGQAPARQAALGAGLNPAVPATTVNKMCGSGMRAIMAGGDQILAGHAAAILAGGLESMTNAPYLLLKARSGYRMGHGEIIDHMMYDGLQSAWDGKPMGCFADATAVKYGFSREDQDAFAAESVRRAQRAVKQGDFVDEIAPVVFKTRKGEQTIGEDETPFALDIEKIPSLKPAFSKDGTVTAA